MWRPDILGDGFEQRDLELPGGHIATLVRYTKPHSPGGRNLTGDDSVVTSAESVAIPNTSSQSGSAAETSDVAGTISAESVAIPNTSSHGDPAAETSDVAGVPGSATTGGTPESSFVKPTQKPAVLYLHGFVDYFFAKHLAQAYAQREYPFYAVDLRGYGRSIGRGNDDPAPNYVPDIAIYAQDLNAARAAIQQDGHQDLVLIGHSTGGLIGPMWANANPGAVKAMILNSPWLDFNANWLMRGPVSQLVRLVGQITPRLTVGGLKAHYGQAIHAQTGGEWDYDLAWKPHAGFPVAASWFCSIRRAQAKVKRGLNIEAPILVMTCLSRGDNRHRHQDILATDSVLDPRQMWRIAPKLGINVEVHALAGGIHDLALSPEPVRSRYFSESLDWLDQVLEP